MPDPGVDDWEEKAARARKAADQMSRPITINLMLEIAKFYDLLATEALDHVESSRPGNRNAG